MPSNLVNYSILNNEYNWIERKKDDFLNGHDGSKYIPPFNGLALKFPWDLGEGIGFKSSFTQLGGHVYTIKESTNMCTCDNHNWIKWGPNYNPIFVNASTRICQCNTCLFCIDWIIRNTNQITSIYLKGWYVMKHVLELVLHHKINDESWIEVGPPLN